MYCLGDLYVKTKLKVKDHTKIAGKVLNVGGQIPKISFSSDQSDKGDRIKGCQFGLIEPEEVLRHPAFDIRETRHNMRICLCHSQ